MSANTRGEKAPIELDTNASAFGTTVKTTRVLLTCGVVAGPLFILIAVVQALTRAGFDPSEHPPSLLSLGNLGWLQITNFLVAGLLFTASAVGMRRLLHPGRGATWAPRLIGIFGAGLIAGGVFVIDAAYGFPPGTPEGSPDNTSWHGILHGIAPVVAFLALIAACVVFARRFADRGKRGWAAYSLATGVAVLALSTWPNLGGDPEGRFLPLWIAIVLGFGWASIMAAQLRTGDRPRSLEAEPMGAKADSVTSSRRDR